MQDQSNPLKILDWIILSLFVIFLASLSNSIFVNQIGYFGALLFILIKAFLTRKNQFSKTGLELAFALYMLAEIVALIFSDYKAEAFHNFTKRALLVPVLYTTITVTTNLKRGKNFFTIFIVASLLTGVVYLFFSVQFYLNNLYVITQSGPSMVQNPITASEIISFTVLFLFAFIINEKTGWKEKLFLLSGFAISLLTLIATYKRTGWMGVAVGMVLILIIKKKWKVLIPLFILGVVLFILDKNISLVTVYDFKGSSARKLYSFETDGRAHTGTTIDSTFILSDFENGISFYKDSSLVGNIETPSPVAIVIRMSDDVLLTQLIDTRYQIFVREDGQFKLANEILPPGTTKNFDVFGESLYILDSDSGITYYSSFITDSIPERFPEFKNFRWLFIDSSHFYAVSALTGIKVYDKVGSRPGSLITENNLKDISRAYFFNGNLIVSDKNNLMLFRLENNELVLSDHLKDLKQVHRMVSQDSTLVVLTSDGYVYRFNVGLAAKFEQLAMDNVSPKPTNFHYADGILYCTYVNRGRLLSFFDLYLPQNFTRLALWRAGWEIFKDHPFFGVGDIDLAKYYLKYKRPYDKEIHGHLHNNYFHFLATLGLFGFLSLMYLFVLIIIKISKIYQSTKEQPFISSYSLGALASFVSILFAGLSELNFWDQEIATLIYFTVGLNIALYIHHKKVNGSSNEKQQ